MNPQGHSTCKPKVPAVNKQALEALGICELQAVSHHFNALNFQSNGAQPAAVLPPVPRTHFAMLKMFLIVTIWGTPLASHGQWARHAGNHPTVHSTVPHIPHQQLPKVPVVPTWRSPVLQTWDCVMKKPHQAWSVRQFCIMGSNLARTPAYTLFPTCQAVIKAAEVNSFHFLCVQ